MIKYSLCFALFLVCHFSQAQVTATIQWQTINGIDTILYNPARKLNWNDFKGNPERKSIATAVTESGFGYRLSMRSGNDKTDIIINVLCFFSKMNSWVKPYLASEYALLHEQHHFDLTYIAACLFFQKLKTAHFTFENCASLLEKINDECYKELDNMQKEYDGQTKNGQLKNIQALWNKKIDLQLAALATD